MPCRGFSESFVSASPDFLSAVRTGRSRKRGSERTCAIFWKNCVCVLRRAHRYFYEPRIGTGATRPRRANCRDSHANRFDITGSKVRPSEVSRYSTFGGMTLKGRRWTSPRSINDLSSRLSTRGAISLGSAALAFNFFLISPKRNDPSRRSQRILNLYLPRINSGKPLAGTSALPCVR